MIYESMNFNTNKYDNLYSCTDDTLSCMVGCLFPYCLFGNTYERAGFGNCVTGTLKMFSLQFILSSIFFICYLHVEYNTIYKNEYPYLDNIDKCKTHKLCDNNLILEKEINLIENPCIVNQTEDFVCDCLKKSLTEYCEFKSDKFPELMNDLTIFTVSLNFIHLFSLCLIMGIFSGYYRKKLSYKLNIVESDNKNFMIHCCPIIHLLALCQENRTLNKIQIVKDDELVRPINVVDVRTRSETQFIS